MMPRNLCDYTEDILITALWPSRLYGHVMILDNLDYSAEDHAMAQQTDKHEVAHSASRTTSLVSKEVGWINPHWSPHYKVQADPVRGLSILDY